MVCMVCVSPACLLVMVVAFCGFLGQRQSKLFSSLPPMLSKLAVLSGASSSISPLPSSDRCRVNVAEEAESEPADRE